MPSTIVCHLVPPISPVPTVKLFADGADTELTTGVGTFAYASNRKWTGSFQNSTLTGLHKIQLSNSGGTLIAEGWAFLLTTGVIEMSETREAAMLNTMIELDAGQYRFDELSLAEAPSGGGANSDPLENEVPGTYDAGTAGYVIGHLPDTLASVVTGLSGSISQDTIANGGTLRLRLGDDYMAADGRQKSFTVTGVAGNWSAGTAKLRLNSKSVSVADITATSLSQVSTTITMVFSIPRTAFAALRPTDTGKWEIFIELASGARFVTPIEGVLDLDPEIPAA